MSDRLRTALLKPYDGNAEIARRALRGASTPCLAFALTVISALSGGPAGATPTPAKAGSGEGTAGGGQSPPSRAECLAAHRSAQELKQSDRFIEAQQQLLVCSSATCPGAVIADCGNWFAELEQRTPSMVLEVRLDGKETDDVKVFVDQKPIADRSHAIKVNPGRHLVRAEVPRLEPYEQNVLLPEGQRMRLISIDFKTPPPPPSPAVKLEPPAPDTGDASRPVPTVVYPLLGIGVVGLASFGVFATIGSSKQTDLEKTCEPRCTDSDLTSMKRAYLIGDVSAAVGIAALLGAATVYFTRPVEKSGPAPTVSIDVGPVGIVASRAQSWGGAVTAIW